MKEFDQIVSEMFKIPPSEINDELSNKDIPEWDSMNYLMFIAELETEFGVAFSMEEVLNASNLGDLRKIIKARGRK